MRTTIQHGEKESMEPATANCRLCNYIEWRRFGLRDIRRRPGGARELDDEREDNGTMGMRVWPWALYCM